MPVQLVKPQHGHKHYMQCDLKCDWFIDGEVQQLQEKRKRTKAVLLHNGHPRKTLPIGKLTPDIRKYVEEQARINVAIPSISAGILEKFGCVITDQSLHHALGSDRGTDYVIDSLSNKQFVQKCHVVLQKRFYKHTKATCA